MLNKLNTEIKEAMISKDASKRDTLRAVKSAAGLMAKEEHSEITNDHVLAAIKKELKMLNGTIASLDGKLGVDDAKRDATYRIDVLNEYLPKMLDKDEITTIVTPLLKALEQPNMGAAMKTVMPYLKGKADGKVISAIVCEVLKDINS